MPESMGVLHTHGATGVRRQCRMNHSDQRHLSKSVNVSQNNSIILTFSQNAKIKHRPVLIWDRVRRATLRAEGWRNTLLRKELGTNAPVGGWKVLLWREGERRSVLESERVVS